MCRLLPLWRSILEEIGCRPHFIIIFRDPLEVAASLHASGTPQTKSRCGGLTTFWNLKGKRGTGTRAFVSFSQLMNDWSGARESVADRLQIQWPRTLEDAKTDVEDFLDARLKHHNILQTNVEPEKISRSLSPRFMTPLCRRQLLVIAVLMYLLMSRKLTNQMLSFSSNALRDDVGVRVLGLRNSLHWVSEQDKIIADRELRSPPDTSRSWRWTAPLRRIWTLFGGVF